MGVLRGGVRWEESEVESGGRGHGWVVSASRALSHGRSHIFMVRGVLVTVGSHRWAGFQAGGATKGWNPGITILLICGMYG